MKKCEQCGGTKRYMETSSVDSMFSELTYCRQCDENGMVATGMTKGQCYGCFTNATYQYHGVTDMYQSEVQRYVDALDEYVKIECVTCQRKVRYERDNGKWREEAVE